MIVLRDIDKRYTARDGRLDVLRGASAGIDPGTFAAITGPSGCGKSTLLLIAGGLLRPDGGSVQVDGKDVYAMPPEKRALWRAETLGFVFQRFHLIPYLNVEENILAAGLPLGKRDNGRAVELMDRLQITGRRRHLPGQLSVGEQQRTALARALFNQPAAILADEPTGNLDPENGDIVLQAFAEFAAAGGTVVMVTHHPDAAARADARWRIGEGRLVPE